MNIICASLIALFLFTPNAHATIPAKTLTYSALGHAMRVISVGDDSKPAILLVHGSPGDWKTWRSILYSTALTARFHLLAVDRPGYGGSEAGDTEVSLKIQADVIWQALQFNHSRAPAIVVGYSFGGAVAERLAMDHPGDIERMLMIAPAISPDLETAKWYEYAADWDVIKWLLPQDWVVSVEESIPLPKQLRSLLSRWKTVHTPMTYMQGNQDTTVSQKTLDFFKAVASGARLRIRIIDGVDHLIPEKRPDAVIDDLLHAF